MKLFKRMKRTTKQYITVAFLCIFVIGGAAAVTACIIASQIKEEYQELLRKAHQEMENNKRNVYIAARDIRSGEALTRDNIKKAMVYSSQPAGSYITQKEIGRLALIDISADTQILTGMVTGNIISSELREAQYQVIHISSNIIGNDSVDIRIVYPNGESYIVLSKKVMKGLEEGSCDCYFWLNEEEILRMSAAIVDAGLYSGTQLITTRYIEPSIQKASQITYTPSLAILALLEKDPNILDRCSRQLEKEVRKALENRLSNGMSAGVSQIKWSDVSEPEYLPEQESNHNDELGKDAKLEEYFAVLN